MCFGMWKRIFILSFLVVFRGDLFCSIIEVIPPNHDHVQKIFKNSYSSPPTLLPHNNLSFWNCLQYALQQRGFSVRATELADVPKKISNMDKILPWKTLKKDVHKILVFNLPYYLHSQQIFNLPKEKLILFMLEPPNICPDQYRIEKMKKHFDKIYTFDPSLVDNKQIFQFFYPVLNKPGKKNTPFQERKLVCMIAANKTSSFTNELYSKRKEAISFFEDQEPGVFDLYGYGWEKENLKNYKGCSIDKIETLSRYRFSICYENIHSIRGYITEKIFDCFEAGCVPIYWGASDIEIYIPKECFIDKRRFSSYEKLLEHLQNITEEELESHLRAISSFLKSKKAQRFSPESFIKLIVDAACS